MSPDPMAAWEVLQDMHGWLLGAWLAFSLVVIAVVDGGGK
jgi:hypothetical protein